MIYGMVKAQYSESKRNVSAVIKLPSVIFTDLVTEKPVDKLFVPAYQVLLFFAVLDENYY